MNKILKRRDIYLIIFICAAAFMIWAGIFLSKGSKYGKYAVISVNNVVIERLDLKKDIVKTFTTNSGTNTVTIKNSECFGSDADCADRICAAHKKISRTGQTIICLPHRLIVEIE